jgi:formylglycine-generating enzyme required for sulfatase activity
MPDCFKPKIVKTFVYSIIFLTFVSICFAQNVSIEQVIDYILERGTLTSTEQTQADMNNDGSIDVADVIQMVAAGPQEITIILPGDVPLKLLKIPSGSFSMGSLDDAMWSSCHPCEQPVHTVNIAYDFYMCETEITQQQWLAVMGSWPWLPPIEESGSGDNYPAYRISWNDITGTGGFNETLNAYIANTSQGPLTVRLPSEAEWEYACRAGTNKRYYFGDSDCTTNTCNSCELDNYGWWCGNTGDIGDPDYGSQLVRQKLPNPWGLYDMYGNMDEFCQDDWHEDYTSAPTDGSAWGNGSAERRIVRGGNWQYEARYARSASRNSYYPDLRSTRRGFRLVGTR